MHNPDMTVYVHVVQGNAYVYAALFTDEMAVFLLVLRARLSLFLSGIDLHMDGCQELRLFLAHFSDAL